MKKPPDKYKCIKVPFTSITQDRTIKFKLFDCIIRTNRITIKTYQLIKLWVLTKYHNNLDIPTITENTIKMAQKSILEKSTGPKPKGDNLKLFDEFLKLHSFTLENGCNLSQILSYNAISIITSIENNIKSNYFNYVKRFVNSYFKSKLQEQLKDKEFKKQLFKELKKVKDDLINNTTNCNIKYHDWLSDNRNNIIPKECHKNGYYYDIQIKPQKYLKHMIWMNIEIEKMNGCMYQCMPLRTDIIPKYITIDTKSIVEILVDKDKNKYLKDIQNTKESLWNQYFNINIPLKNYVFDYTIITDCYSVSIRFIHKNKLLEEIEKKNKFKKARLEFKGLNEEDKIILKERKKANKIPKTLENKQKKKTKPIEFPYIDEVNKDELNGKCIYVDPGKRDLLNIIDDNGNRFIYSNKQIVKATKRLKYQRLIKNLKDSLGITEIENTLSNYNSKTCNLNKFNEYIEEKNKVNNILFKLYDNEKFRQYKWYGYINRKRCNDNMLNSIENKYGLDTTIIYGDWCIKKQMRNFISTPNISVKRKLKERFKVYNIDEYRTSCLHYKTEEKVENLYLPDKKSKLRKLHSVLTFKMENKRKGCINRDYNGCMNIRKIFHYFIKDGTRPERYSRGYEIKTTNPLLKVSHVFEKTCCPVVGLPTEVSNGSRLEG